MNEPLYFMGMLVAIENVPYTISTGETRHQVTLKLRSMERVPQTLLVKVKGDLVNMLLDCNPIVDNTVITAYLSFGTHTFTKDGVTKEYQDITAWSLDLTINGSQVFHIPRKEVQLGINTN